MAQRNQNHSTAALLQQAAVFHKQGKVDKAAKFYQKVLKAEPNNFYALDGLGALYGGQGRYNDALTCFCRAAKLMPNDFAVHFNLGTAYKSLDRNQEALQSFNRTIELNPNFAQAHNGRGSALEALGRHQDALASFDRALEIQPDYPTALSNRGVALMGRAENYQEALACFDRAVALQPGLAQAHYNRGLALNEMGEPVKALQAYDQAVAINPAYADAHHNRANLLRDMNKYEEALAAYSAALKADPNHRYALGDRLLAQLYVCVWDQFDQRVKQLVKSVTQGRSVLPPFHMFALPVDPTLLKQSATYFAAASAPQVAPLWNGERYDHERIRIGYFSADFHNHATAYLMAGLFEQHDRERFEIHAFSFGPNVEDEMRARLIKGFDYFHEVSADSSAAIATKARELEIDIAVDLKGFTRDSRPAIFAHRPAPIQVNYLGFPGTMAASYIDYIIADPVLIHESEFDMYGEKVVLLPDSYQVNDSKRPIAEPVPTRSEAGLPEDGFVFCCFNNSFKITPDIFTIWMRLLQAVPGSVLWLFEGNESVSANLRQEAKIRGVDGNRLVFAPKLPLDQHLARHACADLFIDTFYYNAHTTASDALWAGLPVLTCAGKTFASRVAASLLNAVGMPELVVDDYQAYEAMALKLATEPEALAALRSKLATQREGAALFDTIRFARNIEKAYCEMQRRHDEGLAPDHFKI